MDDHVGMTAVEGDNLAAAIAADTSPVAVVPVNVLTGGFHQTGPMSFTAMTAPHHALPVSSTSQPVSLAQQLATQELPPKFNGVINIEEIRSHLESFANQREWQAIHTPKYMVLETVKNIGRLSEFFQRPNLDLSPEDRSNLGEHVADIMLSVVRLADVSSIDLGIAVRDKLQKNETKYPVDRYRGRTDVGEYSKTSGGKRKRFTEDQLKALQVLAENANWSLLSLPKEERDKFCHDYDITKERLHNFFNNRKPKDLKRARKAGEGEDMEDENDVGLQEEANLGVDSLANDANILH